MVVDVPPGPDGLTPAWLTAALRASGVLGAAAVSTAIVEEVGAVQGFAGRVVRVRLRYDRPETGAPASLVAKFRHPDAQVRLWLKAAYARELRFYREVACVLPTPRLFYGAEDEGSDASVLLFEDLGHLRVGDVVLGCSDDDAFLAVAHLARFHATWWGSPRLDQLGWLNGYAEHADELHETYARSLPVYVQRLGAVAPPSVLDLAERLAPAVAAIRRQLGTAPCTYVHGDFRLDNLFFGVRGDDPPLVVSDWQAGARARGPVDLACFVAWGLAAKQRRALEPALLERYHAGLLAGGVRDYPLDQCREDYRLALLDDLVNTVIAASSVDLGTERLPELARTSFERWTGLIADHHLAAPVP
jgi:hypothetical protein